MRPLDRVIGYNPIKKDLYRIIDVLNNPKKYAQVGVNIPKGILLEGVPGIGKSLMATAFMEECNRKAYIIRKDKSNGDFVDYIRVTFDEATKNAPAIILLDDMDKFANEDYSHRNAEEYVTVQACIDSVKNEDVFVIATVNDEHCLPSSLVRSGRFDKTFHMWFPKGEDSKKIIEFYLKDKKCESSVDTEEISRFLDGSSCADLEMVINEAGIYAVYEGRTLIKHEDLLKACLRKIYRISDDGDEASEESVRRCVVHEAGHALIAELRKPGTVTFISVSSKSEGEVGGFVSRKYQENSLKSFIDKETEIMICLAGKAATEVVLGDIDIGSNRDMHMAFDRIRRLLNDNVAYDFNSRCHNDETSQKVYEHLDIVTAAEVSRYYIQTKQLLVKNRAFLDKIIEELTMKKLLSYKDIARIRTEGGF